MRTGWRSRQDGREGGEDDEEMAGSSTRRVERFYDDSEQEDKAGSRGSRRVGENEDWEQELDAEAVEDASREELGE